MTTLPACALSGLLIFVALVVGPATLIVWLFIRIARKASDVECEREKKDVGVPPWITGTFERLLAFGLLYVGVEEAGAIGSRPSSQAATWDGVVVVENTLKEIKKAP